MKFRLLIVKSPKPIFKNDVFDHFSNRVEKEVIVEESSCCRAVVKANHSFPDFVVMKWEEVR